MYRQSTSLVSFPAQATSSQKIGPVPWPKCAFEYAEASKKRKHPWSHLTMHALQHSVCDSKQLVSTIGAIMMT